MSVASTSRSLSILSQGTYYVRQEPKEGMGLVKVDINPMGRRQKMVSLTPPGRILISRLLSMMRQ
jgi:hypothetical protein